jgi:hypothetical protein
MTDKKRARRKPVFGDARTYWLDNPRNVDRLVYGLYTICALLVLIDIFVDRHGVFAIERAFGFYGIFGFVACFGLVLAAKELRKIVMRPENYYDR